MTNHIIWVSPLIAIVLTFFLIIFFTYIAEKNNWKDIPSNRKRHVGSIPLIGGLAIFFCLIIITIIFNFPKKFEILIYSSSFLVLVGFLDDIYQLNAKIRLIFQTISIGVMIYFSNLYITNIGPLYIFTNINIGFFAIPLTIFVSLGLVNAFNFSDGIDGLAAGQALITLFLVIIALKMSNNNIYQIEFLSILVSVLFIYFLVNISVLPIKKIFLGDAGSTLIGFIISFLLVYYTQKPVKLITSIQALWCVTIPVFDTLSVMLIRFRQKISPFKPDRNHLHYLLIDNGISKRSGLVIILFLSCCLGILGLMIYDFLGTTLSLAFYFLAFLIYIYSIKKIKLIIIFVKKNFKI